MLFSIRGTLINSCHWIPSSYFSSTMTPAPTVTCAVCCPTRWLRQSCAVSLLCGLIAATLCCIVRHLRPSTSSIGHRTTSSALSASAEAAPLLQTLHWLPVQHRITYKTAVLTHKVLTTWHRHTWATCCTRQRQRDSSNQPPHRYSFHALELTLLDALFL